MESDFIYHITTSKQWDDAQSKGQYEAVSLATEGFMHCSTAGQVTGVLERYFKGQTGLVKLRISRDKIQRPLVFELAASVNELFPHIYGPLNLDAVVEVTEI